jgi:hypothetical protein
MRARLALAAAVVALLAGCASSRIDPSVDVAWLLGTWEWGTHSRFEFARDGDAIKWTMRRPTRFLSSNPRWGEKATAEVSGKVTQLSSTAVELAGTYEQSDNPHLLGRRLRAWLTRDGDDALRGEIIGAGNEPLPAVLRKIQ